MSIDLTHIPLLTSPLVRSKQSIRTSNTVITIIDITIIQYSGICCYRDNLLQVQFGYMAIFCHWDIYSRGYIATGIFIPGDILLLGYVLQENVVTESFSYSRYMLFQDILLRGYFEREYKT